MPNWTANSLKLTAKSATSEAKLAELVRELGRAHAADLQSALQRVLQVKRTLLQKQLLRLNARKVQNVADQAQQCLARQPAANVNASD